MPTLTPEAKQLLSTTIHALRERLLRDIRDEAERRYHLSVPLTQAGLDEAHRKKRERLEGWIEERVRAAKATTDKDSKAVRERLLQHAVKEAAATFINRLVLIRHLEAMGLAKCKVVSGGWSSKGYREFRDFGPGLLNDETEGYGTVLQMVFDDLAVDLPGLFGDVGLTRLFPIPPGTLREVVTKFDAKDLESAWTDDTTLGWVYQYWNDPERQALDAKINDGGKIEPHEIASKTQMFTERYMVEWLLQNSLGLTWLCICKRNGWKPDADKVLPVLDARRAEWRQESEAGEVARDTLMPIEDELEEAWKYYVPQPIPDEAVATAPDSVRTLKLLDPACGSGHFLVIAFDLLAMMYREEARHRGSSITDVEIAEAILANNLHGVDIDPRAIQIAAAALYLKARTLAAKARPQRVNLVAPALQIGTLPEDDPSLVQLREELKREARLSEDLTHRLVSSLAGVAHLGTLLKLDSAVEDALKSAELAIARGLPGQGDSLKGFADERVKLTSGEVKATVLEKLEQFLARHSASEDLGLRLDGEQLAAGVRFMRMVKEGEYDVVVGNPPYQGTQRLADCTFLDESYPLSREDLYAVFIERSLKLVRPGGLAALVTIRSWMFVSHFRRFRELLLQCAHLELIADLETGAFESAPGVEAVMLLLRAGPPRPNSVALQCSGRQIEDLLAQTLRYEYSPLSLQSIDGSPIVYRFSKEFLFEYRTTKKLGVEAPVRVGMKTSNNARFIRRPWEIRARSVEAIRVHESRCPQSDWVPYIKGAAGKIWVEPLSDVVLWKCRGLQIRLALELAYGQRPQCERLYFEPGIAFTTIARRFLARAHRYRSIFDVAGSSVFHPDVASIVCLLNGLRARSFIETLNPTINFQVGDVRRLPLWTVPDASTVYQRIESAFDAEEAQRELSVEFRVPGPSPWRHAQEWAQRAVDRPQDARLPCYEPEYDAPAPESFVSFGIGVALARFGANGEGILDESPPSALPGGILFVSPEACDSLEHPACTMLHAAWKEHGAVVGGGDDLRTYLRRSFFDYHKGLYENRPIYFPISSARKSYVAFVSIHRWKDDTLRALLADHLVPERRRLEGELADLREARAEGCGTGKVEKRFAEVQTLLEELGDLIDKVTQIAERGPPPSDDKTTKREVDARFVMDLDDGVMVNSSALWPLLETHWKDPKKWWKELAAAQGRKDFDWAHLAARYFPQRVRAKCIDDPSLAVAHKCFWELHPAKAYARELRLQDEIEPEFAIDEPGSDQARARFLREHGKQAAEIRAAEMRRREHKAAKTDEADSEPSVGPGQRWGAPSS